MGKFLKFISAFSIASILTMMCASTVLATEKVYRWKFFTGYGPTEGPSSYVYKDLVKQIEKETNGRIKIKIFWYGQHPFEGSDMLKVINDNSAEMAHFYGPFLSSVEPAFGIEVLPMLFPTGSEDSLKVEAALWGNFEGDRSGVLERILQDNWGATLVHMVAGSTQRFFTKGFNVDSMTALKGKKIRANSPEVSALISMLGGTPVPLKWGEIYTALQQNMVDGIHTSTYFAKSAGFSEHIDTITMMEFSTAADGIMISQKALESLPEDLRTILLRVLREDAQAPQLLEANMAALAFESLALEGKKIYAPSKEFRAQITEMSYDKIVLPWIERVGPNGKDAVETVQKAVAELKK